MLYRSRTWVGHPPQEGYPLVVRSIPVGVGAKEDPPHVGHVVHTHRRTLEDVTGKRHKLIVRR